jgi:hypothetical protein
VWSSQGIAPPLLTSELDGGEWLASAPIALPLRKQIGGWVGPRTGLDAVQ